MSTTNTNNSITSASNNTKPPSLSVPPLSNETIQKRLLTGSSFKGGARGSLTRCATKLGALHAKLSAQGGSTDQEIHAVKEDLKREIRLFQVEMRKMIIMIQSAETELNNVNTLKSKMAEQVETKQNEIRDLRHRAAQVARTRLCWQEYETLAKLARQRSPRRVLQAKLAKADADLLKTKKQLYETAAESKVREKQFHLLIQCMLDLKRSLGEAVEIPPPVTAKPKEAEKEEAKSTKEATTKEEPQRQPAAKKEEEEKAAESKKTTPDGNKTKPMEVDDEDDLYGGL